MIEIDNKRFRNLQEQVAWLTLMINRATDIVKNIAGTAPDVASLAPASTYSNGTTFAVGAAAPYDYYVALNGVWVELGTMPVAGPAGASGRDGVDGSNGQNGKNGYSIFITSQSTTSGTTFIIGTSIYDPLGRLYNQGDLILSEQGDVFEITASAPAGATVLWRCNITGPQGVQGPSGSPGSTGPRGNTWVEGDDIAYNSGSYSWSSSDWPAGFTPKIGDLYLISTDYANGGHDFTEGDVFIVTNVLAYGAQLGAVCALKGSKGDTGSIFYSGSDLTYDALGLQVEASLSDVPDIRVDDYYLVTSDYTDSGYDFYIGDVYVCTSVGVSTADLSYQGNIRGPQGSAGSPGATGPSGKGVYISTETTTSSTTSMDPSLIYNPDSRTLGAGDVLISATGDVFTITSISALSVSVTYRESIVGPTGSNGQNGAQGSLIFYGASGVYHTGGSGGAYVIDKTSVPDMRLGDYYLSTSTYTSDGETISSGDLWVAFSDASTRWVLSRVMNLTGPQGSQGPAGPGMPTVTIADAGKFAVVNSSGQWAAVTMAEWSGGSY